MKYVILRITYCKRSWARRQAKLLEKATQRERELMMIIITIIKRPVWTEKVDFCKNQKHKLIRKKNRKESSEKKTHKAKTGSPVSNLLLIILVVFFFFNVCSGLFFSCKTLHSPCCWTLKFSAGSGWEPVGWKFPRRMSPAFWQTRGTCSMNAASSAGNVPKPWTPTSLGSFWITWITWIFNVSCGHWICWIGFWSILTFDK